MAGRQTPFLPLSSAVRFSAPPQFFYFIELSYCNCPPLPPSELSPFTPISTGIILSLYPTIVAIQWSITVFYVNSAPFLVLFSPNCLTWVYVVEVFYTCSYFDSIYGLFFSCVTQVYNLITVCKLSTIARHCFVIEYHGDCVL